jgi:uncharacterized protein YndB with AHSA1/START domain
VAARSESDADPADREIVSSRVFDAPPESLFDSFSDPHRLAQWWGPKGFTNTFHEFDFRPGGLWRFTMHGPGGADYLNESVFTDIARPERIAFDHLEPIHRFRMAMTYEGQGGSTRLTWRMLFDDIEECAKVKPFVVEANEQNFDRLAANLRDAHPDD